MFEFMIVLIAVVAAMVAIIVNRRSLIACIVITATASFLCLGFLLLYSNAQKFGSYSSLLKVTIIGSCVLIMVLLAVTYVGVKMYFRKTKSEETEATVSCEAGATQKPASQTNLKTIFANLFGKPQEAQIEEPKVVVPRVSVQPIEYKKAVIPTPEMIAKVVAERGAKEKQAETPVEKPAAAAKPALEKPAEKPADPFFERAMQKAQAYKEAGHFELAEQVYTLCLEKCTDREHIQELQMLIKACKEVIITQKSMAQKAQAVLNRMLEKAQAFREAKQYLLAEQMYESYIERCEDTASRIDAEVKRLEVCVLQGNVERAENQLNHLLSKLRSGEYTLNQEQKQSLAESRLRFMELKR